MNLLSIQSHVAYGHVGNAAAVFALQRLGCEVWPIHTVQFSNHPGHGSFRGAAVDAALVRDLVAGLAERGVLKSCDGVLSGYMGSAVIGDAGRGVYVRPGIVELLAEHAVPAADVITPNQFELEQLTGQTSATLSAALMAVEALRARGPRAVLVTSLHTAETPADC